MAKLSLVVTGFLCFGIAVNLRGGIPSSFSWALQPMFIIAGLMCLALAATRAKWLAWSTGTMVLGAIATRLAAFTLRMIHEETLWTSTTRLAWSIWLWVALGAAIIHSRIVTPWVVTGSEEARASS